MTIADSLTQILNTKAAIRSALIEKGVSVPEDTPFSQYASKISLVGAVGGLTVTNVPSTLIETSPEKSSGIELTPPVVEMSYTTVVSAQ